MTEEEARLHNQIANLKQSINETIGQYEDKLGRAEAENYHLKNQLKKRNKDIKRKDRIIREKNQYIKNNQKQKPKFKNGKRGTYLNGG